jgi:signal peptidase I
MKRVLLAIFLILLCAAAVLKLAVLELPRVSGTDMAPALQPGDMLLASRLETEPRRGQLVLMEHPQVPGRLLLRRVIGMPGERVAVKREVPQINGQPLSRKVIGPAVLKDGGEQLKMKLVEEVLDGKLRIRVLKDPGRRSTDAKAVALGQAYYVLADNRNHGTDSRTFGPVPADKIRAVVSRRLSAGDGCIVGQPAREGWSRLSP